MTFNTHVMWCVLRLKRMVHDTEFDLSFPADLENGMQTVQYDILLLYSIDNARKINQTISSFYTALFVSAIG